MTVVEDQEEICRVCRSESAPDHPLYYPCKCSGSIRFVHEDCLLEWLSHSRKKYCELCEHPFKFSPIYRSDMPQKVPLYVLCRQLIFRIMSILKTCFRFLCVVLVWLVLLPNFTLRVWRFYFWSGENIGFNIDYHNQENDGSISNDELTLKGLFYECLEGQIITAFVIIVFVAAYLFREWMVQNLPDMEADDEADDQQIEQDDDNDLLLNNDNGVINQQHENQMLREQFAFDTLENAFQVLDQQQYHRHHNGLDDDSDDDNDSIRNHLNNLVYDMENERDRHYHDQRERPNSSSFHPITRANRNDIHEDLLFGGLDGVGTSNSNLHDDSEDYNENSRFNDKYNHLKNQCEDESLNSPSQDYDYLNHKQRETPIKEEEEDLILQNDIRKKRRHTKLRESDSDTFDARYTDFSGEEDQQQILNHPLFPQPPPHSPSSFSPREPPINNPPHLQQPLVPDIAIDNNEEVNDNNNNNNDAAAAAADDLVDDDEPFDAADDIDGILEAIGMRGNPWMLLQNSVLMALMISLCLGISIWVPYVLGRSVIMLRPASLIETPIYIMRLVTDPLVDFILDQCIPQLWFVFGEPLTSTLPEFVQSNLVVVQEKLAHTFQNVTLPSSIIMTVLTMTSGKSISNNNNVNNNGSDPLILLSSSSPSSLSYLSSLLPSSFSSRSFQFDWGNFERKMEIWSTLALTRWHQFASGRTGLDRSMCILVGYFVLICLGFWYLSQMKKKQYSPDSFFQDLIRQQGIFLKVLFFFVIEMLIFPIACGFLLDMTTLPLFVNASFESRFDFQLKNPFSSFFLHWFLGTGVLFYFANFITVCREIIRPGVLWYIRDPNDPQFHPVQEMVDKPFATLLQKIGYSAFAYSVMIVFGVGTVIYTLALTHAVFPLRLSFSNPLCSNVAIDFLAVQFLLPPLIKLMKPREYSKKALDWWWHFACRQLRLTSYMFNVRMADEEGRHMRRTLKAWFTFEKASNDAMDNWLHIQNDDDRSVIFQPDGMLVRVPKYDSVIVDPTRRMLVPVDPVHFQPIEEEERGRKHPAAADTNDEDQSTIVVYIPSHFYQRVTIFLVLLWFSISFFICSITVLPLLLGRFLFSHYLAPNAKINDLYSFSLGLYILVAFTVTLYKSYTFKYNGSQLYTILSITKKVTKFLYLVSMLGMIMPLVFGIAVDLFVLMPIRSSEYKNGLVINLSQDWSFGVAYISIIYNIIHVFPTPNRLQRHFNEIMSNGIMQADSWVITATIAAPVILGSLVAITIPGIISWGVLQFLGSTSNPTMQLSVIKYTYPATFCVFMILLIAFVIKKLVNMWMQTVRDDTYLIGKKLHNINNSQDIVI